MVDYVFFAKTRNKLKAAIKRMYAVLGTLQLNVHPDKRYIGKSEKEAESHRLRQYAQRWVWWLHGSLQGVVTENLFNLIWNYVNLKLSG